ncbi:MAG TPA: ester cyclase [Devosia sp.]|jgi:predicted ester cyclase|nr:ester cyclase [Devosia sp.]
MSELDRNKAVVRRFNERVIEALDEAAFRDLMAPGFVNHSAPPGAPTGADGMWNTFANVLHPAFPDLRVTIEDQVAEGDKVVTRKTIAGTHRGALMGIAPTGRAVSISVIDIVRIEDGRYAEHWGVNTLPAVLAQLRG